MKLIYSIVIMFIVYLLIFSFLNASFLQPTYDRIEDIYEDYRYDIVIDEYISSTQTLAFLDKLSSTVNPEEYSIAVLSGHLDRGIHIKYGFVTNNRRQFYGVSENFKVSPSRTAVDTFGISAYHDNKLVAATNHSKDSISSGTAILHDNGHEYLVVAQVGSKAYYAPLTSFLSVNQDIRYMYLVFNENPGIDVFRIKRLLKSEFPQEGAYLRSWGFENRAQSIIIILSAILVLTVIISIVAVKLLYSHRYAIDRFLRDNNIKNIKLFHFIGFMALLSPGQCLCFFFR